MSEIYTIPVLYGNTYDRMKAALAPNQLFVDIEAKKIFYGDGVTNGGLPGTGVGPDGAVPFGQLSAWVTGTNYVQGPPASFVQVGGSSYVCVVDHTASPLFATDLANGDWQPVAIGASDVTGAVLAVDLASPAAGKGAAMVGYLAPYTGAFAQTAQTKQAQSISLMDFIPETEHAAILAGTSSFDCYPAMVNAMASVAMGPGTVYVGGPRIRTGPGKFNFSQTIKLTSTVILEGDSGASGAYYATTTFVFPAGIPGFIVHRYNSSPAGTGGDGSVIKGIYLTSPRGQSPYNKFAPGIWVRARCTIENVVCDGFSGDGIMIRAAAGGGGDIEGNANNWMIRNCRLTQNTGSGLYVESADVNAGTAVLIDASSNGRWGIWDNSFLGNTYLGCHSATNGVQNVGANNSTQSSIVVYGGATYYVVKNQGVAASTTTPGTNPLVWGLLSNTAMGVPVWSSGAPYFDGGAYRSDGLNAPVALIGCYSESGQGTAQVGTLTCAMSGIHAAGIMGGAQIGALNNMASFGPAAVAYNPISPSGGKLTAQIGSSGANDPSVLSFYDAVWAPGVWRLNLTSDGGLLFNYQNGGSNVPFIITGPNSTATFGRPSPVKYAFSTQDKLFVGPSFYARNITFGTLSSPTTGQAGLGDRIFCATGAGPGGASGLVCTTAGTNTSLVWAASTPFSGGGTLVANGGNVYSLVTAGTSAASGGPTGTGAGIADGTCVWNYVSARSVFTTDGLLDLQGVISYGGVVLAAGTQTVVNVNVNGGNNGDFTIPSLSVNPLGLQVTSQFTTYHNVAVVISNNTGASVTLPACTIKVKVILQ